MSHPGVPEFLDQPVTGLHTDDSVIDHEVGVVADHNPVEVDVAVQCRFP